MVAGQAEPDPDFPTAPFPNPEETGVLDPLMELAAETGADVALAHDPDADRLAVAVPAGGRWRLLTGDETGCLLAEHLLRQGSSRTPRRAGAGWWSTPWCRRACCGGSRPTTAPNGRRRPPASNGSCRPIPSGPPDHDLVLGYEEALGYAVGEAVSDKDGIGAALVMAELVADLKTHRRTLSDLLDDLHLRHGVHATGQRSIRFESTPGGEQPMKRAMAALRAAPRRPRWPARR